MYRYNRTKTTTTKYVDGDEDDTKDHPMETNNGRDSQEHLRIDSDRGGSSFSYDGRPKSVEEMSSNMVLRPDMYGDENLEEYFDSPLFFSSAVKFRATLFFIFLATLFNAAIIYNPFFFSL